MNSIDKQLRQIIREAITEVQNETEDLNKYIPKKAFKAVEKLNLALKELQKITGDENPELLDTSSGTESFFSMLTDVKIENGHLKWIQTDDGWKNANREEDWNVIRYDDDEGYWFDEYSFKDQIKYLNSCIKKAIKYFREYNPEMDDDEKAREQFLGDL